ncbi:hypothetical protein ACWD4F_26695 [Streptomyces aureus]
MGRDVRQQAREQLAALEEPVGGDGPAAQGLHGDVLLVARLLSVAAENRRDGGREPSVTAEDVGAALTLFEGMREQLDRLEAQAVLEARRHAMDWRRIAAHQGLNSSQAASQRYQRLITRLEEIRQGVR